MLNQLLPVTILYNYFQQCQQVVVRFFYSTTVPCENLTTLLLLMALQTKQAALLGKCPAEYVENLKFFEDILISLNLLYTGVSRLEIMTAGDEQKIKCNNKKFINFKTTNLNEWSYSSFSFCKIIPVQTVFPTIHP